MVGAPNMISATHELNSTNQRGEMWALITALDKAHTYCSTEDDSDVYIITDSEYLFNAVTKDWISNWENKGWVTSLEEPVKNQDLWKKIKKLLDLHERVCNEVMIYHIKGHLVSLGAVTASKLLHSDPTGQALHDAVTAKYDVVKAAKPEQFIKAESTFENNHGFRLDEGQFKNFVVLNVVADYIAGTYADKINT